MFDFTFLGLEEVGGKKIKLNEPVVEQITMIAAVSLTPTKIKGHTKTNVKCLCSKQTMTFNTE